tara:strand:+ start:1676 stop:1909 length:234 start_codon:yes stop_codon:yes gene_type:complete
VWRLFYINDIIASLQKPKKQYKNFVMNYNTQLCNTAWGKVFVAHSHWDLVGTYVVGHTKTFGALAKEWQVECKTFFY